MLGMRIKISAITAQRKHQQGLSVQTRRGNIGGRELGDSAGQSVFQAHGVILAANKNGPPVSSRPSLGALVSGTSNALPLLHAASARLAGCARRDAAQLAYN